MTFYLSKFFTCVILPPGGFIFLLITVWILSRKKCERAARVIVAITAAVVYMLSTVPVRDALLYPLETAYGAVIPETAPKGAPIIVLGGGVTLYRPEGEGKCFLTGDAMPRVWHAFMLHRATDSDIFVTSGRVYHEAESKVESEGVVMRRALIELGVDPARIRTEDGSRNTFENATMTAKAFPELRNRGCLLVTSAYHMPRSMYLFGKAGLDCIAAPTDFRGDYGDYNAWGLLPSMPVLADSHRAMREYMGLLFYWMKLGLGLRVF